MAGIKELLGTIFGGKSPIDSVKDIIGEFHVSPEDKQKIADALDKKQQEWRDFETKILEIDLANTQGARDMNVKLQGDKPTFLARNMGYMIDLLLVGSWLGMTFYILAKVFYFKDIDSNQMNIILGIYSGVNLMAGTVVNFHRGSSQGSVEKQKMIDRLTQQ